MGMPRTGMAAVTLVVQRTVAKKGYHISTVNRILKPLLVGHHPPTLCLSRGRMRVVGTSQQGLRSNTMAIQANFLHRNGRPAQYQQQQQPQPQPRPHQQPLQDHRSHNQFNSSSSVYNNNSKRAFGPPTTSSVMASASGTNDPRSQEPHAVARGPGHRSNNQSNHAHPQLNPQHGRYDDGTSIPPFPNGQDANTMASLSPATVIVPFGQGQAPETPSHEQLHKGLGISQDQSSWEQIPSGLVQESGNVDSETNPLADLLSNSASSTLPFDPESFLTSRAMTAIPSPPAGSAGTLVISDTGENNVDIVTGESLSAVLQQNQGGAAASAPGSSTTATASSTSMDPASLVAVLMSAMSNEPGEDDNDLVTMFSSSSSASLSAIPEMLAIRPVPIHAAATPVITPTPPSIPATQASAPAVVVESHEEDELLEPLPVLVDTPEAPSSQDDLLLEATKALTQALQPSEDLLPLTPMNHDDDSDPEQHHHHHHHQHQHHHHHHRHQVATVDHPQPLDPSQQQSHPAQQQSQKQLQLSPSQQQQQQQQQQPYHGLDLEVQEPGLTEQLEQDLEQEQIQAREMLGLMLPDEAQAIAPTSSISVSAIPFHPQPELPMEEEVYDPLLDMQMDMEMMEMDQMMSKNEELPPAAAEEAVEGHVQQQHQHHQQPPVEEESHCAMSVDGAAPSPPHPTATGVPEANEMQSLQSPSSSMYHLGKVGGLRAEDRAVNMESIRRQEDSPLVSMMAQSGPAHHAGIVPLRHKRVEEEDPSAEMSLVGIEGQLTKEALAEESKEPGAITAAAVADAPTTPTMRATSADMIAAEATEEEREPTPEPPVPTIPDTFPMLERLYQPLLPILRFKTARQQTRWQRHRTVSVSGGTGEGEDEENDDDHDGEEKNDDGDDDDDGNGAKRQERDWQSVRGGDLAFLSEMKMAVLSGSDLARFRRELTWLEERARRWEEEQQWWQRQDPIARKLLDRALGLTATHDYSPPTTPFDRHQQRQHQVTMMRESAEGRRLERRSRGVPALPPPLPPPPPPLTAAAPAATGSGSGLAPASSAPISAATPTTAMAMTTSQPGPPPPATSVHGQPPAVIRQEFRMSSATRLALSVFKVNLAAEDEEQARLVADHAALQQSVERTQSRMAHLAKKEDAVQKRILALVEQEPEREREWVKLDKMERACEAMMEQQTQQWHHEIEVLEARLRLLEDQRRAQSEAEGKGLLLSYQHEEHLLQQQHQHADRPLGKQAEDDDDDEDDEDYKANGPRMDMSSHSSSPSSSSRQSSNSNSEEEDGEGEDTVMNGSLLDNVEAGETRDTPLPMVMSSRTPVLTSVSTLSSNRGSGDNSINTSVSSSSNSGSNSNSSSSSVVSGGMGEEEGEGTSPMSSGLSPDSLSSSLMLSPFPASYATPASTVLAATTTTTSGLEGSGNLDLMEEVAGGGGASHDHDAAGATTNVVEAATQEEAPGMDVATVEKVAEPTDTILTTTTTTSTIPMATTTAAATTLD
ncbi:hypothetical protein DFQ26_001290 [Actinomortierella ambigua]|nr:hypothetical protein DFQ26_001290 [Actinomortierella ambigua]